MAPDHSDSPLTDQPIAYLGLAQAARRFPSFRSGRPVHTATVTRWITGGVRLSDGTVLKLAAKRLPGRWVTWDQAIEEFVDRLTADRTGDPPPAPSHTSASRERALARADAELARIGI
jgi:hypothetical protein